MNGLLTIYKKQDIAATELREALNKGLNMLSHRGDKARSSFLMDRNIQYTHRSDTTARLAMGVCSENNETSHIASRNGNLLFFAGRLINKNELCEKLQISAENTTDADLVFDLINLEGTACLKNLRGFWSLIYLDSAKKVIYGARDHFGNRQLHFCSTGKQFALASESRTLYTLFEDAQSINKNRIADFLLWGNIGQADQYFFNDIHSLEPSHFVKYEIEKDRLSVEKYYTLPYNCSNEPYQKKQEQSYTEMLNRMLTESVQKNIELFDRPLAIGLSGGMDSSALLCTAKKIDPQRQIVAYTTTDTYDGGEAYWAEKVVRHTNVEWVKVVCTSNDLIEQLEDINRRHNMPLFNASSFTQYKVTESVKRQGQSVLVDGQGGDEMLGGYPGYAPVFLQSLRKNGRWKEWWAEFSQVSNSGMTRQDIMLRRLKLWTKRHYYSPYRIARRRKYEYESLMPNVRDELFNNPASIPEVKKENLNDTLFESYTIFLGNILRWSEHSAALNGIECIMPLSNDLSLTEFCFSIPSLYKIHDGWNKYLLRKAMVGTVPDDICWRKQKMGFYFPEQNWLNEMEKAMSHYIQKTEDPEGCINRKYLAENLTRLYSSKNPLFQRFIFRCYSYLLWRNGLA